MHGDGGVRTIAIERQSSSPKEMWIVNCRLLHIGGAVSNLIRSWNLQIPDPLDGLKFIFIFLSFCSCNSIPDFIS
jgi:hypothetical protein